MTAHTAAQLLATLTAGRQPFVAPSGAGGELENRQQRAMAHGAACRDRQDAIEPSIPCRSICAHTRPVAAAPPALGAGRPGMMASGSTGAPALLTLALIAAARRARAAHCRRHFRHAAALGSNASSKQAWPRALHAFRRGWTLPLLLPLLAASRRRQPLPPAAHAGFVVNPCRAEHKRPGASILGVACGPSRAPALQPASVAPTNRSACRASTRHTGAP